MGNGRIVEVALIVRETAAPIKGQRAFHMGLTFFPEISFEPARILDFALKRIVLRT